MLSNSLKIEEVIHMQIQAALWECCPPDFANQVATHCSYFSLINTVYNDSLAYSKKDPASVNSLLSILQNYTSFKAILHYRIANFIFNNVNSLDKDHYALFISNRGKILSGAEIHYKCKIGCNFVLDHGYGTVIGETSIIGNNCYLLGGIILGASGIANNPVGRRHPEIGNNVEIGAFSRIFGNIKIGDNVFIGSNCVITADIPEKSSVVMKTSNQIIRSIQ